MDRARVEALLRDLRDGKLEVGEALERLRDLPYEDLGFAKLDGHRDLRRGFPEVVYCPGKTLAQIVAIVRRMHAAHDVVLATRASPDVHRRIRAALPRAGVTYHAEARIVAVGPRPVPRGGQVLVVTAGTSDIPVAEEAAVTASYVGVEVDKLFDVGVAGVHRVLDRRDALRSADSIVVVAGMEGALPSVVAGLVDVPVVAVPTSVGYGASFGGLAALLGMMNSCAPGVAVVNIDNGFGAGYLAALIARRGPEVRGRARASRRTRRARARPR
ncbi:MAG: 1-(5-phosphoribosyl)-5-amino-4-imidazole-carboxylate carboxylase [Euryarchaeota archaeon RBG_19FT_COMBO_69_17]|nr:MAG: 1-(5-phosphoribosyl)-5-amino-4-imidazole-carboxylate carboxylase [Euryarchaeota archaeon RBG_19FT_COMBO_69_17]